MAPTIDIIIVNWNAGSQLRDCLESVARADQQDLLLDRVVVVDNASRDGSADSLDVDGLPLTVIRNSKNLGFAAACNQGARGSRADYLLFLNPDTQIKKETLAVAARFMERPENQNIGICGVPLVDAHGQVSPTCARFPALGTITSHALGLDRFSRFFPSHFMTDWAHDSSREVDQVMGAFFFVRRHLFEALAGFDERFFVYYEEVDFSLRARQHGYRSFFVAEGHAFHKGGGTSDQIKATRMFYSLRSRLLFASKHFGRIQLAGVVLVTLAVEPLTRLGEGVLRGSLVRVRETMRAYADLFRALPSIFSGAGRSSGHSS